MAAVRTLQVSTLPPWTTNGNSFAANVSFVFTHDRSMDVILQNQRGEGFVKQVFRLLLSTGCKTRAGGAGMVLDIGSNTGYYSMASAAHGCPVIAFDAQPGCKQWFEQARAANDQNHTRVGGPEAAYFDAKRVRIITRPVSANPTPVEIDQWACWVMHKIDVRLQGRRRRRRAAVAMAAPRAASGSATANSTLRGSMIHHAFSAPPPPPPPPPSPPPGEEPIAVNAGKVAARPIGSTELLNLLPPSPRHVLLAKVDTEGAELGVLAALEPLLPRIENLLIEIAPGWWPLYANKSKGRSALRGGEGRPGGRAGRISDSHAPRTAEAAAAFRLRFDGSSQLARLLMGVADGGWGFRSALTSTARLFTTSDRLHEFLVSMGSNGYWHQADVWFTRDAATARAARHLICIRQQASERARAMCGDGSTISAEREHLPPPRPQRVLFTPRARVGGRGRGGGKAAKGRGASARAPRLS